MKWRAVEKYIKHTKTLSVNLIIMNKKRIAS
ncbi:hypothetical protein C5S31_07555 [ANME-1 cluster archaeon GoMg2]|nr:hypothetical protein [ANME-1 cluster archaeon GoMg2]